MTRRASLPGAAELFRTTSGPAVVEAAEPAQAERPAVVADPSARADSDPVDSPRSSAASSHEAGAADASATARVERTPARAPRSGRRMRAVGDRTPSGRERHDEKITVYCSPEELVDLETTRLHLRADHGLAIDRGRIVREAVAVVLADFEAKGENSILVRRLRES